MPVKYDTFFNDSKTYLLIGCLGGLGRSMSRWMFERGARKFLFLGRSGLERQLARDFVQDLQKEGAEIQVVRGDVGILEDVEKAVAQIEGPIGGVIQAAMGLDVSPMLTSDNNPSRLIPCQGINLQYNDSSPVAHLHDTKGARDLECAQRHQDERRLPRLFPHDQLHLGQRRRRDRKQLLRFQLLPRPIRALPSQRRPPRHEHRIRDDIADWLPARAS